MPEAKDITDPSVKFSIELGLVHPTSHDDQVRKAYIDGCKDGLNHAWNNGWERGYDSGYEQCLEDRCGE